MRWNFSSVSFSKATCVVVLNGVFKSDFKEETPKQLQRLLPQTVFLPREISRQTRIILNKITLELESHFGAQTQPFRGQQLPLQFSEAFATEEKRVQLTYNKNK